MVLICNERDISSSASRTRWTYRIDASESVSVGNVVMSRRRPAWSLLLPIVPNAWLVALESLPDFSPSYKTIEIHGEKLCHASVVRVARFQYAVHLSRTTECHAGSKLIVAHSHDASKAGFCRSGERRPCRYEFAMSNKVPKQVSTVIITDYCASIGVACFLGADWPRKLLGKMGQGDVTGWLDCILSLIGVLFHA